MNNTSHPIERIAVIGSGYMGGGIAQVLALSGHDVVLGDVDAEKAEAARSRLVEQARRFESDGLFAVGAGDTIRQRLFAAESVEAAVDGAGFIAEAVFERRDVKADALGRISRAASSNAVIGSNTSAIPISELAEHVLVPERFLGVHWMNPAPFIPGVEIIPHAGTAESAISLAEELVAAAGKQPGRVSDSPGFVANRLQFALFKEAVLMVEEGLATPAQIDTVVSNAFGFRLALFGPFAIADMAGLDVYDSSYGSLEAEYGERFSSPAMLHDMVAAGNLGLKAGHGFLDIPSDRADNLVSYRDKAYAALSELRRELGAAPGLGKD
jgi:3-hydroxybutyryl-CoA dehydrogenase